MMGYTAPSKKAIRDAIKLFQSSGETDPAKAPAILRFWNRVQETSLFGSEARVPGENTVVGPDAYSDRRWYATLTVDAQGTVVKVR